MARANWITKIKHLDSVCGCNCVRSVDKNCLGFVCSQARYNINMQEGEQVVVCCFMYSYSRASIWCNL